METGRPDRAPIDCRVRVGGLLQPATRISLGPARPGLLPVRCRSDSGAGFSRSRHRTAVGKPHIMPISRVGSPVPINLWLNSYP